MKVFTVCGHPYPPFNASEDQLAASVEEDISNCTVEYKDDVWIQISKLRLQSGGVLAKNSQISYKRVKKIANHKNKACEIGLFTSNRFEALKIVDEDDSVREFEDDDCQINDGGTFNPNNRACKRTARNADVKTRNEDADKADLNETISAFQVKELKKVKESCKPKSKYNKKISDSSCLDFFETKNRFDILEDNPEEDYQRILTRRRLLPISKKNLSKCKKCNFKRRSCLVDLTKCKAYDKSCFKCKRNGHFPQSPQCKVRNELKKKVQNVSKIFVLNKDILFLIKRRILELEGLEDNAKRSNDASTEIKESTVDISSDEIKLIDKILNVGNYCARIFSSRKKDFDKKYFIRYCNRKITQVLKNQSIPSLQICESIKKTLDIADNIVSKKDQDFSHKKVDDTGTLPSPIVKIPEYIRPNMKSQDSGKDYKQNIVDDQCSSINDEQVLNLHLLNSNDSINSIQDNDVFDELLFQYTHSESEDLENSSSLKTYSLMSQIPQLDGFDEFLDESLEVLKQEKTIFSVNCHRKEIVQLLTFFRSFNSLWISLDKHALCNVDHSCFFCHMRSSCLKLRKPREKGPRGLKCYEYICQLDKYESELGWNWKSSNIDLAQFIENTLKLLMKNELSISTNIISTNYQCKNQEKEDSIPLFFKMNPGQILFTMKDVVYEAILQQSFLSD